MAERRKVESSRNKAEERALPEDNPEVRRLTSRQVAYLARETGVATSELVDLTVGDLAAKLKWHFDPSKFFFQKVCGRVVKRHPVTGVLMPVPFATVHVEDTDCNFLFYAPSGYGYVWLWPFLCSREEIATVVTDECGYFCVWIPRWDIDRLLRWRLERICLPTIEPPRLIDIFADLLPDPGPIIRKPPLPDPPPDFRRFELRREVEARVGPAIAQQLALAAPSQTFGAFRGGLDELLTQPAPKSALPMPPLPDEKEFGRMIEGDKNFERLEFRPPLGPFRICFDVIVPEWQTILDIPDVTFRVTQTQGGSDVTIYDEGYFDVRWNDTSIPDLTLEAWSNAQAAVICDGPEIACTNVPAILNVAQMPLEAGYHDDTIGDPTFGYGLRVNQHSADGINPLAPGSMAGVAHAPYADRLDLFGCFHIPGATHYRVMASFEGGPAQPILAGSFVVWRSTPAGPALFYQTQLVDGWYEIHTDFLSSYEHYILGWIAPDNGTWELTLQLGAMSGGSINPVGASSQPHTFEVDQSAPNVIYHKIRWWYEDLGPATATTLTDLLCPIINRSKTHPAVIVEVTWSASAAHLRSARLAMHSCKDGALTDPVASHTAWWWKVPADTTTGIKVATYRILNTFHAGCYTADVYAVSRAYNPAVPSASLASDWYVHEDRRWVDPIKAISVVDI